MSRDRTLCMMRVRNEEKWIRRSLERTFAVAATVLLFDDGSTDGTEQEAESAYRSRLGCSSFHCIRSPFLEWITKRPRERVNEVRDKNLLWSFAKVAAHFDHVLCLDGDEILSREAVRRFPEVWAALDAGSEIVSLPFLYLWDSEGKRRVDALYGDGPDGQPLICHARIFTVKRMSPDELFDTCFSWDGAAGGFHCGSIPQTRAERDAHARGGSGRPTAFLPLPVMHMGYLEDAERRRKFEFYNQIDPNNLAEGCYRHIVGEPDHHAPGPVILRDWSDT